jgi:hypothetical protein
MSHYKTARVSSLVNSSGSLAMFAAIRRASSPKVLEIKYGAWGFPMEASRNSHEDFAVHFGSFRRYRLHRKIRRGGTKLPLVHQQT